MNFSYLAISLLFHLSAAFVDPSTCQGATDASSLSSNLVDTLWKYSEGLAHEAYGTEFIQKMLLGKLDPNSYGQFLVEDIAYLYKSIANLQKLKERAEAIPDADLAQFAESRITSFTNYAEAFREAYHIKDVNAIEVSKALQEYIDFLHSVINSDLQPEYLLVAMAPCEKLWDWLANKMDSNLSESQKNENIYYFWVNDNKGSSHKIENYVNQHSCGIDLDKAKTIFKTAVNGEMNFFKAACNETYEPLQVPDWIKIKD